MYWSVCIFAHNEERLLPRCLAALEDAACGLRLQTHIMVNGATDGTAKAANAFAAVDRRVHVHETPVGDKAGAWNDYLYRFAGDADMHVFIDADITPAPGSIPALAAAFEANPLAYAAAALPGSGRNRRAWSRRLLARQYLSGNLYALSRKGFDAVRERDIRLPFGAKGEDGILSYLMHTNLKGGYDDGHKDRIAVAPGALFYFDSLGLNARDLKIYYRRLKRYSERHYQKQILYRVLKSRGTAAMPENIYDIYTEDRLAALEPRRDPVNYWVDRAMLKTLKSGALRRAPA
ncbi:MAG: glycosyltransferase [Parvularculaceae bacterium]